MEKFNRYLKDLWILTQHVYKPKRDFHLNVALGNVSGDMDSVVCSILLGYYLTYKQGFYEEEKDEVDPESITDERCSKFCMPLLNMAQSDIEARSEILHHFDQVGVNKHELPATDIIDLKHYADLDKLGVNLVDHNHPDCTQEFLQGYVERIYDHHSEKKTTYPKLVEKDVRFCGSAGSLVAKLILEDSDWKDTLLDKDIAFFASAPILIDTVNFKEKMRGKKWDEVDKEIFDSLKEIAGDHIPDNYFDTLYDMKTDVQTNINLGLHLLLRKDYKNYMMGETKMGISTIFISLDVVEEHFGDIVKQEMDNIMKEKELAMYTILTHYEVDDDVRRQVCSYAQDEALANKLLDLYDGMQPPINLERVDFGRISEVPNANCWQNHSTDYSRKKFEPFIREYFETH